MNTPLALPGFLKVLASESRFELLGLLRSPGFVIPTLSFPLGFYSFFGLAINGGDWQPATYLLATYATFGIMGPALFGLGGGLAMDRGAGLLTMKQASPLPMSAYLGAKLATAMVFALAVVLLLSLVAGFFGGVAMERWRWGLLFVVMVTGTLPFAAIGLLIGALMQGQAAYAVVNLVYLPMALLSGLWVPLAIFPELLQTLAVLWPSYYLSQIALWIVDQPAQLTPLPAIASFLAYTVACLAAANWAFKRMRVLR